MTTCVREGKQDKFKSLRDLSSDYPARNILKQRIISWLTKKIFARGGKALLKDLKTEDFRSIMMKYFNNKLDTKNKKKASETKMVSLTIESLWD